MPLGLPLVGVHKAKAASTLGKIQGTQGNGSICFEPHCRRAVTHFLRDSDLTGKSDDLQQFNDIAVDALLTLLNLHLSLQARKQTLLPIADGGLSLQNAVTLAEPTILASMHQIADTVQCLAPDDAWNHFVTYREATSAKHLSRDDQPPGLVNQGTWIASWIAFIDRSLGDYFARGCCSV